MADVLFEQIISTINAGWPQHFQAGLEKREGLYVDEVDGRKNTLWTNPEGTLVVKYSKPHNPLMPGHVLVHRGDYPDYTSDYLHVYLFMDYGDVVTDGEDITGSLNKYMGERVEWLNESKKYLDHHDKRFPIHWTPFVRHTPGGTKASYTIHGSVIIPLGELDDVVDELSRLFVGSFNTREHPNDYDDYLYLNQKGYMNDSWSKPA